MFRYKKGARARRLPEFKSFQLALCEFAADDCGLAEASHLMARLGTPASGLVGRALKAHEDELDAIACALAAFHFIRSGSEGMQLFGDATEGYIAVPVATSARARSCP
jgi:predicted RNase H-like nuclease